MSLHFKKIKRKLFIDSCIESRFCVYGKERRKKRKLKDLGPII